MESYTQMKARHQREVNALPIRAAFSNRQFKEMMEGWGLTEEDTDQIYSLGAGCFVRRADADNLHKVFQRHHEEMDAAVAGDKTGDGFIKQMFLAEMANYEYGYTGDLEDTLDALGLTVDQINRSKPLRDGLRYALKEYQED